MSFFSNSGRNDRDDYTSRHHSSRHHSSSRPHNTRSSSSFFSRAGSSSSYYKRRPRDGYIAYLLSKLKRLIADLWTYARRHPVKAFFAIVVPLVSAGGAVHGLLRQFGVRLPMGMEGLVGGGGMGRGGGGYYGSSGYGDEFGGGGGMMGTAGSLFKIAQAFM